MLAASLIGQVASIDRADGPEGRQGGCILQCRKAGVIAGKILPVATHSPACFFLEAHLEGEEGGD
jgi:hypothetical protein